jgi:hypothetical protein
MRSPFLLICFCLCCAISVHAATAESFPGRAAPFELLDQYGKQHCYVFPRPKVSVLLFADREGSEQIENWVRPLYKRYQDTIDINGVAILKGVPTFAQGLVRTLIRNRIQYPVMLDWSGDMAKIYDLQPGAVNLIVVSREGGITLRVNGASNQENLLQCFSQIDRLLSEDSATR